MRLEQDLNTYPRLLRKPALGEVSDDNGIKVKKGAKKADGSRFVGPTQLDEKQKSRICRALKQKKIGDEMGRQIFICALEYQMSAFSEQLAPPADPEPEPEPEGLSAAVEETLQAIVGNAAGLSSLLRALPEVAKARVTRTLASQHGEGHTYGESYLSELSLGLDRLGHACIAAAGEPASQKSAHRKSKPAQKTEPAVNRELIAKLAGVFSDCFEMEATADEGGPFHTSLEVLADVTGLAIGPEPAFLAQVLTGQAAKRR